MHELVSDLKYGVRLLLRSPGFAAASVLCLALGIGATTAIFTVVSAVVLRPLAYRAPEQLVRIYSEFPNFPGGGLRKFPVSGPEFLDLRRDLKLMQSVDAYQTGGVNLAGTAEPLRVTAAFVSGGLLGALGVAPLHGRLIDAADDQPGTGVTAVIGQGLWQRAFGGDRDIVGKSTVLNGQTCTIIGIMPASFTFPPADGDPPELWTPLRIDPANPGGRSSHSLSLLARANSGVGIEQARQEIAARVEESGKLQTDGPGGHRFHPKSHPVVTYDLHNEVTGAIKPALLTILGAVGFVLLIACVNVANLLLARAESRSREIAIRKAIGAGAAQLVRQFAVEGLLLAVLGTALGIGLAYAGLDALVALAGTSIPRSGEIAIDGRVLGFTVAVLLATGVFFGMAPLAHAMRGSVAEALKAAGSRVSGNVASNRLRKAMVVTELAVALVLLVGAGLMIKAFWRLQAVNTGVRAERLLTMRIALPQSVYRDTAAAQAFWSRLQDRLAAVPGVESATLASGLPPQRPLNANDTQIEGFVGTPGGPIQNIDYWQSAGRRYFETMGIPIVEGRSFNDGDGGNAPPVVIINQTFARMFYPGKSPIGRRVRPGFTDPWRTIVGVAADVKNGGIDQPTGTELYFPIPQAQSGVRGMVVVARTAGDPAHSINAIRREIAALDPALPISQVRTFDEVLSRAQTRPRFLTTLLALFSTVALILAAIGIYGLMSYAVAQRTSEFGIRLAIGARPADVLRLVLGQGLRLGVAGLALGAAGALALARLIQGLLFGVSAFDPLTFLTMGALLLGVIAAACLLPALRATRVDPLIALRYE